MAHVERLRPYLPALYNPDREIEQPIPPVDYLDEDENNVETDDDASHIEEESDDGCLDRSCDSENCVDELSTLSHASEKIEDVIDENPNRSDGNKNSVVEAVTDPVPTDNQHNEQHEKSLQNEEEIKPIIRLDRLDTVALDNLFANQNETLNIVDGDQATNIQGDQSNIQNNIQESKEQSLTTIKCDDGLEFTFSSIEDFRPKDGNVYQMKANDPLCGNRPFKMNVRFITLFL